MRWRRHNRGDAAQPVVSDASYDQQLGEIVDELGLPLQPAFAYPRRGRRRNQRYRKGEEDVGAIREAAMSTTTTHEQLVTPVESFKCWCAGELVELRAGISFISRTHPIVLRFPSRFGLNREAITLDGQPVSEARNKTARPAPRRAPAATSGPTLHVHETTGRPIGITQDAMAAIRTEVDRWDGQVTAACS